MRSLRNGPRDTPVVRATLRAISLSQHIPTAVTSLTVPPGAQPLLPKRGPHETTAQRYLIAHYMSRKGPILFCSREMESIS